MKTDVLKKHVEFFSDLRASIRIGDIARSSEPVHTYHLTYLKFQKTKLSYKKYTVQFLCIISWGAGDLNSILREILDGGNYHKIRDFFFRN